MDGGQHDVLIAYAPHPTARTAAMRVLESFPEPILHRLLRVPVRIWLLDRGQSIAAAPLPASVRRQRWLDGSVGLANCAGLTFPVGNTVRVIAPWDRPVVLRHELGHAASALLTANQRAVIEREYATAQATGRVLTTLAGRSIGEHVACAIASSVRPGGRRQLSLLAPELASVIRQLSEPPRTHERAAAR